MTIAAGTKLGPYEILSAIGAGGMGEVYRARDARLNRDVALKVIPEAFIADSERMARFEREAKLLASLNHSHIAAIYGLEESSSTNALVMELVEGPTLADRIAAGPIPLDEALPIAKQIAEALEYAHDHGVIHRDLKPANIKVKPDGTVKVLDFGLAKALLDEPTAADMSNSPTLSMAATMAGTILGTAAYMSPEQARGKTVDRRADIWAFGAVLFEMLTGRAAFAGEDVSETLAFVMTKEPAFDALPAKSPLAIRTLLRRCLEKNLKRRLQHIGEARIAIEDALSGATPAEPVASGQGKSRERLAWVAAAVLLLTTIGLGTAIAFFYHPAGELSATRFFVSPPEKATFDAGTGTGTGFSMTVISPDGRRLAFTARDPLGKVLLWVRPLDTLAPQALQGTDNAAYPFWSPDSRSIGFFVQGQGKLKRISVAGGPAVTLCDAPSGIGGTWNRDGVIIFAPNTNGPLYRMAAGGGESTAVTKTSPLFSHRHPSFLPDGRHFLYFQAGRTAENSGVFVAALDSNESKRLLAADTNALYSASGDLLFIRQGTLLRQSFDLKKLELSGDPTPVAELVATSINTVGAFSVSENGVLVYRNGPGATGGTVQLAWFDRAGKPVETIGEPAAYRGVNVSPDGKRIAVHRHDSNGGDIWIFDSARRESMSRFTFDASQDNSMPIWSSDGSRIAFGSLRNGKWGIYQKPANATGREELLVESDLPKMPMSWSPDGKFIAYWVSDPKTGSDVWVLPLAGDRKAIPFLQSPFNESWSQISPDGKWIAYSSNETGRYEIYVRPFPAGEGKWQISTNGGWFPRWRRDGKELFYMAASSLGKIISVKTNPVGPTFEYGDPNELFDSGYINFAHGLNYFTYTVSADGQRFLIPRGVTVESIEPGARPAVIVSGPNRERIEARMVVAADGRDSACRKWAGFTVREQANDYYMAGVLLNGVHSSPDVAYYIFNPVLGTVIGLLNIGGDRFRAYFMYPKSANYRLQGAQALNLFSGESAKVFPQMSEIYEGAKCIGPLASFDVSDAWVEHPYMHGVALVGDAAATTDPTFGQGLSLAFHDARVLRDELSCTCDWESAGNDYAEKHRKYFGVAHTIEGWFRTLFQDPSPQAALLRAEAMPRIAEDPSRVPDHLFSGPDLPLNIDVRARFFGER